jgi:hypothetical protein
MEAIMTADEFGFGPCKAETERSWPCTQAAVDDSGLCRYHSKVARHMTRRYVPEPATVTTKKAKAKP